MACVNSSVPSSTGLVLSVRDVEEWLSLARVEADHGGTVLHDVDRARSRSATVRLDFRHF